MSLFGLADVTQVLICYSLQAPSEPADQPKLLHKEQQGPLLLAAGKHSSGDLLGKRQSESALPRAMCQLRYCWLYLPLCSTRFGSQCQQHMGGSMILRSALLASADCGTLLQDHCHCWPGLGDQSQQLLTGLHRRCSLASTSPATYQGTEGTRAALHGGAAQQVTGQRREEVSKPALPHQAGPKVFVGVLTAAGNAAARQAGDTQLDPWPLHAAAPLACSCAAPQQLYVVHAEDRCAAVRSTWGADPRLHKVLFFSAKPWNASLFAELRR